MHRLDKHTSGVLVLARSADAANWICEAFRDKTESVGSKSVKKPFFVRKQYWAIVEWGRLLKQRGTINNPITVDGNRLPAKTLYYCKEAAEGLALLKLTPETGVSY